MELIVAFGERENALLEQLVENGFVRTDLVGEAGEFAFRGGILDLFPPNTPQAVRVELFGDTIDSLRWLDVETQRSEDPSGPVTVYPMTQFPVTRATRQKLARRISLDFMDPHFRRDVTGKIEKLQENGAFPGIEHYVPVAVESVTFANVPSFVIALSPLIGPGTPRTVCEANVPSAFVEPMSTSGPVVSVKR